MRSPMVSLSNFLAARGWSRDDATWLWLQVVSIAGLILSGAISIPEIGQYLHIPISDVWTHRITGLCTLVLLISGKMDKSHLPSEFQQKTGQVTPSGSIQNPSRFASTTSVVLLLLGLGFSMNCGKKIPNLPSVVPDATIRTSVGKAYGLIESMLSLLNDASEIEEAERVKLGQAPIKAVDDFFVATAKALKKVNDDIDAHALSTWDQIKARVDPIIDQINAFLVKPTNPSQWLTLIQSALNIGIRLLTSSTQAAALPSGCTIVPHSQGVMTCPAVGVSR